MAYLQELATHESKDSKVSCEEMMTPDGQPSTPSKSSTSTVWNKTAVCTRMSWNGLCDECQNRFAVTRARITRQVPRKEIVGALMGMGPPRDPRPWYLVQILRDGVTYEGVLFAIRPMQSRGGLSRFQLPRSKTFFEHCNRTKSGTTISCNVEKTRYIVVKILKYIYFRILT